MQVATLKKNQNTIDDCKQQPGWNDDPQGAVMAHTS